MPDFPELPGWFQTTAQGLNVLETRRAHLDRLRQLKYGDLVTTINPPKVSIGTAAQIASPLVIPNTDRRITYAHGVPQPDGPGSPYSTSVLNKWISTPSAPANVGSDWSQRIITDSPQVEFRMGDWHGASSFHIWVDGNPLSRSRHAALTNSGSSRYIMLDFGNDTQGILAGQTCTAGGSGYAVGDEVTITGGTFTSPMVLVVTSVTAGAITTPNSAVPAGWYVKDYGVYTVLPGANAATTTNGSGTGATFTLSSASPAQATHSTRKMRRIEIFGNSSKFVDLRVTANSTVRPWGVRGTRLFIMTDSYGDTLESWPAGSYPWRLGARLGIEDVWVNGRGSTGFLADNAGNSLNYRGRLDDFKAVLPTDDSPAVLITQGSINDSDSAGTDAALQAEVEAYWDQFFLTEEYVHLFGIQIGIMRSSVSTPSDTKYAALKAGFQASQAKYDPEGKRTAFIETRGAGYDVFTTGGKAGATNGAGNTDFWDYGDGAHPHQAGHDFLGDALAVDVLDAIHSWVLA